MPLKVTLVQAALRWQDPAGNRAAFDATLAALAVGTTDLVILPEMFTTGFAIDGSSPAEPPAGPTLDWLRGWAGRLDAAVTGSVATLDGGRRYNRLWFVAPDGSARS